MHEIARAAADAAQVPDFGAVLRRGHRHRNVRNGVVLGAAALAFATIVGVAQVVDGPGGRNEPGPAETPTTADLPGGGAPTVLPYWQDGAVHVGDVSVPTDLRDIRYGGGTTVVGQSRYDDRSDWFLVDGSELVPIVETANYVSQVIVSPDGEVVALNEHLPNGRYRLSLWDVGTRSERGAVVLESQAECCDAAGELFIRGIDLAHRVFFTDTDVWMWQVGTRRIRVTGVDTASFLSQPWPRGVMFQGDSTSGKQPGGVYGTVDDEGGFHRVGITPTDQLGLWSPDGATFAYMAAPDDPSEVLVDGGSALWAQPAGGEPVRLPLEEDAWWPVGWESDTRVVFEVRGEPSPQGLPTVERLARCDVVEVTCALIEDHPVRPMVWAEAGAWS